MQNFTYSDFYSEKINNLTLKEAIEIHYTVNPQFQRFGTFKTETANSLIKAHDITHIIFGCNTGYDEEIRIQLWTRSGVIFNIPKKDIFKYLLDREALTLLLPKGIFRYIFTRFLLTLKEQEKVKKQASLMVKKWEYFKEDSYMDKTIGEIRKEFGITILPHDINSNFVV
jgi:ubiquinone biosynthesis protein Coq4